MTRAARLAVARVRADSSCRLAGRATAACAN